jgi:hypothetical protein
LHSFEHFFSVSNLLKPLPALQPRETVEPIPVADRRAAFILAILFNLAFHALNVH